MAVTFDAKSTFKTVNGVATLTINNLTVGSGSNRALAALVFFSNNAFPSGLTATWDSGGTNQAMTLITGTDGLGIASNIAVAAFGLIAPTSGTKNLVISWTGNLEAHAEAVSFTGVDQTSVAVAFPNGTKNLKSSSTASPCTVTITSATGNIAVAGHSQQVAPFGTISGTTLDTDISGPFLGVTANYDTGAATVTLTAAFSGSDVWASFGFDVAAVSSISFTVPQGNLALSETVPSVVNSGATVITPPSDNFVLSSHTPDVNVTLKDTTWNFVDVSGVVTVTTTSHALTEPTGVQQGDLLVAVISSRIASTTSITLPSGGEWTLVAEQKTNNVLTTTSAVASGMMAYCKRGASAPNLTFTHPTAPSVAMGRIVAYRGLNPISLKDTQTSFTTATNTTSVSGTGLTTTFANDLIVKGCCGGQEAAWSAHDAATDPTTSSGTNSVQTADPIAGTWQERQDSSTTTGADTSLAIADAIRATAGATGNLTCTASLGASHVIVAGAFVLDASINITVPVGYISLSVPLPPTAVVAGGGISSTPAQANLALSPTPPIVAVAPLNPNISPASANLLLSGSSPTAQSGVVVPTFVWGVGSTTNDNNGINGNDYKFSGVNPTLSGNALILTIAYPYKSGRTISISDSAGDTWPSPTITTGTASLSNINVSTFVLPNASVGLHTLTITFDASIRVFQYAFAEFYNLATSSLADGSAGASSDAGPGVAATSYTPSTNNDANGGHLIWTYAISNDTVGTDSANKASAISASGTAKLMHADNSSTIPSVSSFDVQATNGAINPGFTITQSSATNFVCSSVALKVANAGTPPSAGIRVVRILHCTEPAPATGNNVYLFPSDGNLLVATMAPGSDLNAINSVTDSNSQTYTDASIIAGTSRVFYKENATSSNALTLTLNLDAGEPQFSLHLFDVVGAATSSFDTSNSVYTAAPGSGTVCNDLPDFTPTSSPGLTIVNTGFGTGPTTGLASGAPAGAIYDLVYYTGMTDQDRMDNADGFAHYYHSTNAAQTWNWVITSASHGSTAFATAASFKSAPLGVSLVPAQGNITLSPTSPASVQNINRIPSQGNLALSPTAETVALSANVNVTPLQGNLALSPTAETVALSANRNVTPLQGNLALSPTAETVALSANRNVTPLQGNLALSPTAETVTLSANVNVTPLQGNLALSPTAETVTLSANRNVTPLQGNLALSSTAETVALSANVNVTPLQGNLVLSPTAETVALSANVNVTPLQGNLALSPTAETVALSANVNVTPLQGNLATSPVAPSIGGATNVTVPQGNLALSPTAETVAVSDNRNIIPLQGNVALSQTAPASAQNINRSPSQGNAALSSAAPSVTVSIAVAPAQGNAVLSPTAPTVVQTFNRTIVPLQGNAALSGTAPTVSAGAGVSLVPPQGNVVLSPTAPAFALSDNKSPLPLQGNAALSGTAPTVAQTLHRNIVVPQGDIALSGTAPSAGGLINRNPLQGNVILSSTAPVVARTDHRVILPVTANLGLSTVAPTIFASVFHPITVAQGNLVLSTLPAQLIPGVYEYPEQANLVLTTSTPIIVMDRLHPWRAVISLKGNIESQDGLSGENKTNNQLSGNTTQNQSLEGG